LFCSETPAAPSPSLEDILLWEMRACQE
jgi:hypothetical protein